LRLASARRNVVEAEREKRGARPEGHQDSKPERGRGVRCMYDFGLLTLMHAERPEGEAWSWNTNYYYFFYFILQLLVHQSALLINNISLQFCFYEYAIFMF
jgi:hypothetical protein